MDKLANLDLVVYSVFGPVPGSLTHSMCSITKPIHNMIKGNDEHVELPIVAKGLDKSGKTTRKFDIKGVPVWVTYNGPVTTENKYDHTTVMLNEDIARLRVTPITLVNFEF
jgi:hypothetical protein